MSMAPASGLAKDLFMEFYHPGLFAIRSPRQPDATLPGVLSIKQKEAALPGALNFTHQDILEASSSFFTWVDSLLEPYPWWIVA